MLEHVKLGDVTYFGITTRHPSSGMLINADETPRFFMYRNGLDTAVIQGAFTARANLAGTYRSSGNITSGNGFSTGDYVEIHASGKVYGVVDRIILKSFVIDEMVSSNIVQWSGEAVRPLHHGWPSVNVMEQSGIPVYGANNLGSIPADIQQWRNQNTLLLNSLPAVALSGTSKDVINDLAFAESAATKNSANLLNTNLSNYNTNNTLGSGLNKISANIYYAGIKLVKDSVNVRDEYLVQWFRNSLPVSSGEVTNPALSVYKTSDGDPLTENRPLEVTSRYNGVLRYNETSSLVVSGEPYLVTTSGIIDGGLRVWNNPVGIDSL